MRIWIFIRKMHRLKYPTMTSTISISFLTADFSIVRLAIFLKVDSKPEILLMVVSGQLEPRQRHYLLLT